MDGAQPKSTYTDNNPHIPRFLQVNAILGDADYAGLEFLPNGIKDADLTAVCPTDKRIHAFLQGATTCLCHGLRWTSETMFEGEDEQHVDQALVVQELRKGVREGKRKADGGLECGVSWKERSFHEQACELVDFVRGNGPLRRGRKESPSQHLLSSLTPLITFAIEHVESEEEIQCASVDQQFVRQHQAHDRRHSVNAAVSDQSNEVRAAMHPAERAKRVRSTPPPPLPSVTHSPSSSETATSFTGQAESALPLPPHLCNLDDEPTDSSDGEAERDMQSAIEAGTTENALRTTDALDESDAELHGSRPDQASPMPTLAHQVSRERLNHTITSVITATTTRRGAALEKYNTGFEAALLFAAGFDASTLSDDNGGEDFVAGFCAGSGVVESERER
ncbi:hypothetical protein LTR66_003662 [Elasticomyces elasticus]|nr:hypothetical protein LTR66_003662 [Elasticomyces elasticus]